MANSHTYKVRLDFDANTSQAQKSLQGLQQELSRLGSAPGFNLSADMQKAKSAALELASILKTSTDMDGQLNLTKFNHSLRQSGKTLGDFKAQFAALGREGDEAFMQLSKSILNAKAPLTELNGLMGRLWHSFKQTARYQFTASIYRNLIGGIQSAYNYAQDLNESLNNIRIVTGQSTEQMAKFAETANKAAQSLSVTTTEYTNGALIYYQQGLDDETVKARTDVTMKLANASGVSAETASQQLTAIWNNFAKGAENLEYYADVMTALGASTASSSSEIAEGLEKFAGIANSVGLSYEYAAAALATVTATTRQSADVVGTAFKTLFARIQDLEVGETLEDGTTLGKYSQALAAIGVNIKDANGDLKDMDNILDEMGSKWQDLSRDMKVAVAQTVAG